MTSMGRLKKIKFIVFKLSSWLRKKTYSYVIFSSVNAIPIIFDIFVVNNMLCVLILKAFMNIAISLC